MKVMICLMLTFSGSISMAQEDYKAGGPPEEMTLLGKPSNTKTNIELKDHKNKAKPKKIKNPTKNKKSNSEEPVSK